MIIISSFKDNQKYQNCYDYGSYDGFEVTEKIFKISMNFPNFYKIIHLRNFSDLTEKRFQWHDEILF